LRLATELHGDEVAQAIQLHQLHMAYAPGACRHCGRVNEDAGGQYMRSSYLPNTEEKRLEIATPSSIPLKFPA
jgi:hypothetical protein